MNRLPSTGPRRGQKPDGNAILARWLLVGTHNIMAKIFCTFMRIGEMAGRGFENGLGRGCGGFKFPASNVIPSGSAFADFCEQEGITHWRQLRRIDLNAHVDWLVRKGHRRKAIQHRIAVVSAPHAPS